MFRLKNMIALLLLVGYIGGVIAYAQYEYTYHHNEKLRQIDRQLEWAVKGADLLLGEAYHDTARSSTPHSREAFLEAAEKLSSYAKRLDIEYVYSFIRKNGMLLFDSTSLSEEEWKSQGEGAYEENYLLRYDDATEALKQMFDAPKVVYEESTDQWGTFRSVLMPFRRPDGSVYVIGADIDVSSVARELRTELINSLYKALFQLLIILPFVLFYWWMNRREKERLREVVHQKTEALEEKIAQIREQELLMVTQSRFAAMGEMLSMIAHQWRQPLSTMTLMITNEKISAMLGAQKEAFNEELLDKISDTLIYLSDTIDNFQNYFRPDKKAEMIDLCEIVERALQFTEARLKMQRISVEYSCADIGPVETYPSEMLQVLMNILNNAADALGEHGGSDKRILVNVSGDEERVRISIEDSGGGIDEAVLPNVFEPYFSTKSKNGTGLGLYMAKMIVEEHIGGLLSVENSSLGARFVVELPRFIDSGEAQS